MRLKKPLTFGVWRKRYKDRNANLHFKLKEDYKQYHHYFDKREKELEEKKKQKKNNSNNNNKQNKKMLNDRWMDDLLSFDEWRYRYRYRNGKPHWNYDDDSNMYRQYLYEYKFKRYRQSRGPEIDKAIEDHASLSYDELVKKLGIEQAESIRFKQHQECKLFRCLKCWLLIHPEDEIKPFKEGFIHKLCQSSK